MSLLPPLLDVGVKEKDMVIYDYRSPCSASVPMLCSANDHH